MTLIVIPIIYLVIIYKKALITFLLSLSFILIAAFYLLNKNNYLDYAPNKLEVIFHEGDFDKHLESTVQLTDMSGMERVYRWIASKNALKNIWLTGTGPSTFYDEYKKYTESLFETYVSDNPEKSTTHNYYLLIFFEQGIIGLLLFIVLVGVFLHLSDYYNNISKEYKTLIIATSITFISILIHQFLGDQIETDEVGSIFYLCIGIFIYIYFNEIKKNENGQRL
jgi:O-antigen ligase